MAKKKSDGALAVKVDERSAAFDVDKWVVENLRGYHGGMEDGCFEFDEVQRALAIRSDLQQAEYRLREYESEKSDASVRDLFESGILEDEDGKYADLLRLTAALIAHLRSLEQAPISKVNR